MMQLTVLTPEQLFFEGPVSVVRVPGVDGRFAVLPGHAPIISALEKGPLSFVAEGDKEVEVTITGGFIEVLNNKISILAQQITV